MHRALALYSGGLDSLLSILILREQNIDITALKFLTGFVRPTVSKDLEYAERFGFQLKEISIIDKFIQILKHPEHGYGKNLNPCIDCKILMLTEAKKLMKNFDAEFIITGEVVSQRPMSQKRELLIHMEKKATLEGLILRPLSAKLLPITEPESKGIVKRDLLYGIWGRTRTPHLMLSNKFGLNWIPQPSGGCLLTDPSFCRKVKDLIDNNELTPEQIQFLKIGRHFRVSEKCKAIVARNESESNFLLSQTIGVLIHPSDFRGPVVLLLGELSNSDIDKACRICVYYSKRKRVQLIIKSEAGEIERESEAFTYEDITKYRI